MQTAELGRGLMTEVKLVRCGSLCNGETWAGEMRLDRREQLSLGELASLRFLGVVCFLLPEL